MQNKPGAVVQLVRISACHAGGRGFESRPHREKSSKWNSFLFYSLEGVEHATKNKKISRVKLARERELNILFDNSLAITYIGLEQ